MSARANGSRGLALLTRELGRGIGLVAPYPGARWFGSTPKTSTRRRWPVASRTANGCRW